jgi:hypothetical protein
LARLKPCCAGEGRLPGGFGLVVCAGELPERSTLRTRREREALDTGMDIKK